MSGLSRDPLDNPDLTPEWRAALEALTEAERIALGDAVTAAILAQLDALIARSRDEAA